jgi:hypothetical protein
MARRTKFQQYRAFSDLFSDRRPRALAGELSLKRTDRAVFLVGLQVDHLRSLVGKTRTYRGESCQIGGLLTSQARKTGRITADDLRSAIGFVRSHQRKGAGRGPVIGYDGVNMSAIRVLGSYKGKNEKSARVEIINDGTDSSSAAFKANMRKLAQELGCGLAQKVVITSIDKTPKDTFEHSPTGMPDPK